MKMKCKRHWKLKHSLSFQIKERSQETITKLNKGCLHLSAPCVVPQNQDRCSRVTCTARADNTAKQPCSLTVTRGAPAQKWQMVFTSFTLGQAILQCLSSFATSWSRATSTNSVGSACCVGAKCRSHSTHRRSYRSGESFQAEGGASRSNKC